MLTTPQVLLEWIDVYTMPPSLTEYDDSPSSKAALTGRQPVMPVEVSGRGIRRWILLQAAC